MPLGVVILGLVEAQTSAAWLVVTIGARLVVGRILNAAGMLSASVPLRGFGMILIYLALLIAAGLLVGNAAL